MGRTVADGTWDRYNGLPDIVVPYRGALFMTTAFFSETGAGLWVGFTAILTRWNEEYQEWFYKEQIAMMKHVPDNFTRTFTMDTGRFPRTQKK